ncbi:MAG: DUF2290 domain-containing protein [Beijerinckiaceae bacterium]
MVTEANVVQGIRRAWQYASAVGIDQVFSDPRSLKASDEFKEIALSTAATYEEVYLYGLSGGQYNILLADYAYLQFGGNDENSLRYAYYPNPFLGASQSAVSELTTLRSFVDEGIIDMDEFLHSVSEIRHTQHPPLVRYENAADQYKEDLTHPCSHFHLGHHLENRWPVRRVLTPGAFALIIFKYFYPEYWTKGGTVPGGNGKITLDEALIAAKRDCRILPDHLFSEKAGQQFCFG